MLFFLAFADGKLLAQDYPDDPFLACLDSALLNSWSSQVELENEEDIELAPIPSIDTYVRRFEKMQAKTPMPLFFSYSVKLRIETYLLRAPGQMAKLMAWAEKYFPIFEERLDHYNMPMELKYLAVVESALNPQIRSRAGAVGLWQIMYPTAKFLNLEVSSFIDERMDPYASTDAACRYLNGMYEQFGDWQLVLAAYNCGPGRLTRALRRVDGAHTFKNVKPFLPRETQAYLPKFMAVCYLFEYADAHGIDKKEVEWLTEPWDTIMVNELIYLDDLAELLDIDEKELKLMNPSFKLGIIPKLERKKHKLVMEQGDLARLVMHDEDLFAQLDSLAHLKQPSLPKYQEVERTVQYRVKQGDILGTIAQKYGVSVSKIKKWNNLRSDRLKIGQRLVIYPSSRYL